MDEQERAFILSHLDANLATLRSLLGHLRVTFHARSDTEVFLVIFQQVTQDDGEKWMERGTIIDNSLPEKKGCWRRGNSALPRVASGLTWIKRDTD